MSHKIACPVCSTEFEPISANQMFCSHSCRRVNHRMLVRVPMPDGKKCRHCGTEFTGHATKHYCSILCRNSAKREASRVPEESRRKACPECSKEFIAYPSQKFCSVVCRNRNTNKQKREASRQLDLPEVLCQECKMPFKPIATFHKICSDECRSMRQAKHEARAKFFERKLIAEMYGQTE